ncbi:MAG: hypothetical protein BWY74_02732 [Firmicutes bacterium ADurb.Bin419]|nr:MAG: hypothetical protein BWY74_02732 [Firmicutes bacterium ADurb.Bin419]
MRYTVDGSQYERPLNFYSSGMYVGEEISIYYLPEQPNRILAKSSLSLLFLLFPLAGLIAASIGFTMLFKKVMRIRNHKYLLENGEVVNAEITKVIYKKNYSVNGVSPYVITCKWIDPSTGIYYFFTSDHIWFDPEPIIIERDIKNLPVYIDRYNPKKYSVSLEELEKMVADV